MIPTIIKNLILTLLQSKNQKLNDCPEHKLVNHNIIITVFLKIVPIGLTFLFAYIGLKANVQTSILVSLIVIALIFNILSIWSEIVMHNFADSIFKIRRKEVFYNEISSLIDILDVNIYKNSTWTTLLMRIWSTIIDFLNNPIDKRKNEFNATISAIISEIHDCLTFINDVGEKTTIALYIHDRSNEMLLDYISKKSPLMFKKKRGRNWSTQSESHLAHTFRMGEKNFFYNIQDFIPGVRSSETLENDKDNYKASITFPLKYSDRNQEVRAVFCITSNQAGAFSVPDGEEAEASINQLLYSRRYYIILIGSMLEYMLNQTYPEGNEVLVEEINNPKKPKMQSKAKKIKKATK